MAVWLIPDDEMNRTIANLPGVQFEIQETAEAIGNRARGRLAAHKYENVARIEVEHNFRGKFGHIDSMVSLVDPDNALAIEFGHQLWYFGQKTEKFIPGLYIVTGAAGLA
jgi:hypothetical protein